MRAEKARELKNNAGTQEQVLLKKCLKTIKKRAKQGCCRVSLTYISRENQKHLINLGYNVSSMNNYTEITW